jgi:hypothetical protein
MFQNIIEIIKMPVSTLIEKSQEEDLKKGIIKGVILSVVMSLISVLMTFINIIKSVSKSSLFYGNYTNEELWEKRWDRIKDAELFSAFFKQILIYAVVIAIFALILFVIAKLLKSDKDYSLTLSMTNNTVIVLLIGMVLSEIISLIYAPLAIIVMSTVIIYSLLSLIHAFRDSLEMVNTDKLVLISTGVIVVTLIIIILILMTVYDISFKDISTLTSLFSKTSSYMDLLDY